MATALVKSGDAPFFSFVNCQRWDYIVFLLKCKKFFHYFAYTFFVYEEASLPGKAENPQGQDASLFALSALLSRTYREFDS